MSALDELLPHPLINPALTDWPLELGDHLSASRLSMFQRCPEQYRRRYVLGQKERPGAAMVWGSADHYAHEQNFTQKITSGEDITEADVKLAFAEGFDQAVDRNGGPTEVEWGTDKPGDLKDKGAALVGVYHGQVSPRVQPTAVEEKFTVEIPGVAVPAIGYIDIDTEAVAIERKTASRKESKPKPDWRIQGLLYQAVRGKPVDWHVSTKTKLPAVYTPLEEDGLHLPLNPVTVDATRALVRTIGQAMVAYWRMYGPDRPWPGAITHPWACDFCGFRPNCAWWAGEDRVATRRLVSGSFVAPPVNDEVEAEALARTLLDIGVKKGQRELFETLITNHRAKYVETPKRFVAWLQDQLEKQMAGAAA